MKKRYYIGGVALLGFLALLFLVLLGSTDSFDHYIYLKIISLRNPFFDVFFRSVTKLGNALPVACIALFLFCFLKKEERILLGSSLILTGIVNQLFKYSIQRIRPDHLRLIEQKGYSFPSGHAMVSMCLYGICIYFVFYKVKNKILKCVFIFLLSFLILMIGVSRIYVGVHYPTDILAGYFITIVLLIVNFTIIHHTFRGNLDAKNDNQ